MSSARRRRGFGTHSRSYHAECTWDLSGHLQARGLRPANAGELALFGMWSPAPSDTHWQWDQSSRHNAPDQSRRAIIEQCPPSSVRELTHKGRLADFFLENELLEWAPETVTSPQELRMQAQRKHESRLWFLKHTLMSRNKGVTVYHDAASCLAAWLNVDENERGDYVAQKEAPSPALSSDGRKLTLRVYVCLIVSLNASDGGQGDSSDGESSRAWALANSQFACRVHPKPYDASDPDAEQHILSNLGEHGVDFLSSEEWLLGAEAWPKIRELLVACVQPFLKSFLAIEGRKVDGPAGSRSVTFDMLGADIIIDKDLRPWLLEFNRMPQLQEVLGDTAASLARRQVLNDLLTAVLDPFISADEAQSPGMFPQPWEVLAASDNL